MAKLCLRNFTFPLLVLVLSLFFGCIRADFTNPFKDIGCNLISCGEGACVSSNDSFLGFGCECKPGWKKIQIGSLSFPSCVVPNCSVDFACGSNTSSPPPPAPPPPASLLPPLNFSDPCTMTWCGNGTCTANGTGHICSCHEGYSNLLNRTNLACFKQCSLGAECANLGFDFGSPTPSSRSPAISESTGNGANGKLILWRTQLAFLTLPLITAIFIYSV